MLNRTAALLLLAFLAACTGDGDGTPGAPVPAGDHVPVYFVEGHGLIPEFRELPSGDPVEGLLQLISAGPRGAGRTSFVSEDVSVLDTGEREADESVSIQLNDAFWSLPEGERFAAAAQIVYTVATLEEGKRVLLMNGTVPGRITDGNGERVAQPLTRESLDELEPWIQLSQPVAGAVVGSTIPVQARLRGQDATAVLVQDDDLLARGRLDGGAVLLEVGDAEPGPVELVVELTVDGARHTVRLPLVLSG
ncbi:MAG: GerMN domain-containing protein [Actinomycetota bacterium]